MICKHASVRVRLQLILHFKTCTTDIYLHNECAHVGLSIDAPVYDVGLVVRRAGNSYRDKKSKEAAPLTGTQHCFWFSAFDFLAAVAEHKVSAYVDPRDPTNAVAEARIRLQVGVSSVYVLDI